MCTHTAFTYACTYIMYHKVLMVETLTDFIENQIGKNFRFGISHNVFAKILGEDYLLVSSKYTYWHQSFNQYRYNTYVNVIAMCVSGKCTYNVT